MFQTRARLFNGTDTSSEGAFTAGGGVRALVADRMTLGFDMRVGWNRHSHQWSDRTATRAIARLRCARGGGTEPAHGR